MTTDATNKVTTGARLGTADAGLRNAVTDSIAGRGTYHAADGTSLSSAFSPNLVAAMLDGLYVSEEPAALTGREAS